MIDFLVDAGNFLFSRQMILVTVFSLCFIFVCVFEASMWLYQTRQYNRWLAEQRKMREARRK